jgi:hypothetical protein
MSTLSPGVQILIDQLANNPDEFFGSIEDAMSLTVKARRGKFAHWRTVIENELLPGIRPESDKPSRRYAWFLNDAEKAALIKAYTDACRVRFDTQIISTLTSEPVEEEYGAISGTYATNLAQSMLATKNAVTTSVIGGFGSVQLRAEGAQINE